MDCRSLGGRLDSILLWEDGWSTEAHERHTLGLEALGVLGRFACGTEEGTRRFTIDWLCELVDKWGFVAGKLPFLSAALPFLSEAAVFCLFFLPEMELLLLDWRWCCIVESRDATTSTGTSLSVSTKDFSEAHR